MCVPFVNDAGFVKIRTGCVMAIGDYYYFVNLETFCLSPPLTTQGVMLQTRTI